MVPRKLFFSAKVLCQPTGRTVTITTTSKLLVILLSPLLLLLRLLKPLPMDYYDDDYDDLCFY